MHKHKNVLFGAILYWSSKKVSFSQKNKLIMYLYWTLINTCIATFSSLNFGYWPTFFESLWKNRKSWKWSKADAKNCAQKIKEFRTQRSVLRLPKLSLIKKLSALVIAMYGRPPVHRLLGHPQCEIKVVIKHKSDES